MYVRHHTVKQVTARRMAANPDEGDASVDATSVAKYRVGDAWGELRGESCCYLRRRPVRRELLVTQLTSNFWLVSEIDGRLPARAGEARGPASLEG